MSEKSIKRVRRLEKRCGMYKLSVFGKIKQFIGGIGFKIFLWSIKMTQKQYLDAICAQEREMSQQAGEEGWNV